MTPGVDLHVHTHYSDGLYSPTEIVQQAVQVGLGTLAITDHDTVDGIPEAILAASDRNLELIPGVELSAFAGDTELHILGYLIDHTASFLIDELARFRQARENRAHDIMTKLNGLGIAINWEQIARFSEQGTIGRPHIARALVEGGHVDSVQTAFELYLSNGARAFVPRLKMSPQQAIDLILTAGGVPVLAHPWEITRYLTHLVDMGLAGIEVYYTGYSPKKIGALCRLASWFSLLPTGGSDFHGEEILPANLLGGVQVPDESARRLYEWKAERTN